MNSNIGTSSIVGKIFNPIVTTLSFTDLQDIYLDGRYLPVSNSVIFSIPKDGNGKDLEYEGSIWLTDSNGYLYPMTPPYSKYLKFEEYLSEQNYEIKHIDKVIKSIKWNNDSIIGSSNISSNNPLLSSNYKIDVIYEDNTIGTFNINESILNFKITIDDNMPAGINWYTNAGTYYIKAIIPGYRCKNGKDVESTNTLLWTIIQNENNNENNNNGNNNENNNNGNNNENNNNGNNNGNNNSTYYYWYIGRESDGVPSSVSNIQTNTSYPGWHEIGSILSGFVLDTNENKVILDADLPTPLTDPVFYYVVIPIGLNIYDSDNASADYLFDPVSCSMSGYKAYKYNDTPGYSVKGIILKQ